jgi:hypothetical protein
MRSDAIRSIASVIRTDVQAQEAEEALARARVDHDLSTPQGRWDAGFDIAQGFVFALLDLAEAIRGSGKPFED